MKEYTQVIKGHYDDNGAVKAIDILNDKPLTADFKKTRPDIKQRVEKAINTKTYLATYQRGTRLGFKWITLEEKEGKERVVGIVFDETYNLELITEDIPDPKIIQHPASKK